MKPRPIFASPSVSAMIAAELAGAAHLQALEPVGTKAVEQIAEGEARTKAHRGIGKRKAKAAIRALVEASRNTVVVHHLKPTWLKAEVLRALQLGLVVTEGDISELKRLGYEARGTKLWRKADGPEAGATDRAVDL